MKKALSETGTIHLFSNTAVIRHTGRHDNGPAQSLCGGLLHGGPFSGVGGDPQDLDDLCENCAKAIEDDEDDSDG